MIPDKRGIMFGLEISLRRHNIDHLRLDNSNVHVNCSHYFSKRHRYIKMEYLPLVWILQTAFIVELKRRLYEEKNGLKKKLNNLASMC